MTKKKTSKKAQKVSTADLKRKETLNEARKMLRKYGRCAVIRPTGFGKTGIATRIVKTCARKKETVLYLYPSQTVKDAVLNFYYGDHNVAKGHDQIKGVEFATYMKVVSWNRKDNLPSYPIDLIVMDELHSAGAEKTMAALDTLIAAHPEAQILGLTATPQRSDRTDEVSHFFTIKVKGKDSLACTSEYTMHNAFKDKLFKQPYYVDCLYADAKKNCIDLKDSKALKEALNNLDQKHRLVLEKNVDEAIIAASKIYNIPNTIRTNCDQYTDPSYMKFICFFRSFAEMKKNGAKLEEWFHEAYPEHKVYTLKISSENEEYHNNVMNLSKLTKLPNHIDLIFACDMLNLGYHVDDLTGIVMFRGTKSPIIYPQQFGRVISTDRTEGGIIFDLVENIDQLAVYDVLGKESKYTTAARDRLEELDKKKENYIQYQAWFKNPSTVKIDHDLKTLYEMYKKNPENAPKWSHAEEQELSKLQFRFGRAGLNVKPKSRTEHPTKEQNLIAIGVEAHYRDIIRKTVAESVTIRARQAAANWLECGGKLKDETSGRVYTRQEVLSHQPEKWIPLAPYAKIKMVAVEKVLDELNVPEDL